MMIIRRISIQSLLVAAVLLAGTLTVGAAGATTVASGFDSNSLAANDDGSTGLISLPFTVNYFGTSYSSLYVNNNGNVTFTHSLSTYRPSGLGSGYSGYPIIAPFWDDVDTNDTGSGLTSYGTGTYAGHTAFGVTWPHVGPYGYYDDSSGGLNTFQLIMVDRSDTGTGNFDFYFNYGQILWDESGAAAGYNAGQSGNPAGTYGQLAGSLSNDAFLDGGPNALISGTNDGVTGQFLFQVRNGNVSPPASVPEPGSLGMLALGLLALVWLVRRRRLA